MNFVSPAQYSKSNLAHFNINRRALTDFLNIHPRLGPEDRLLDFGCGTGETTLALAEGELGGVGTPGEVVGVDLSQEMIQHCQSHHKTSTTTNLSFTQLDVTRAESFISSNLASFSCLTSFSCLHWVQDMPAAVRMFNKVLKVGGKVVLVMADGENMEERIVYDQMKTEERWTELLDKTSWMHFGTVNVNHGWMSTVDEKTGFGNIDKEDFVKLLESQGFRVDEAKTVTLDYKLHHDFVERFVQDTILHSFPEIVGEEREEFFTEYFARVKELEKIDPDGYHDSQLGGIQIIAEKISSVS